MKLNNKLVEMHNMKDLNFNKENYFNKQHKNKKKEESF